MKKKRKRYNKNKLQQPTKNRHLVKGFRNHETLIKRTNTFLLLLHCKTFIIFTKAPELSKVFADE